MYACDRLHILFLRCTSILCARLGMALIFLFHFRGTRRKRIQSISSSFLAWPLAVWNANYKDIIKANGMDAYFFVRFLRMMVKILLPIWLLSWAILLPTNSVRTRTGNSGNDKLARFTFGNISSTVQYRYAAHVIMVYIFTCESSF